MATYAATATAHAGVSPRGRHAPAAFPEDTNLGRATVPAGSVRAVK